MHPLVFLCVVWLLPPPALTLDGDSPLGCVPRRTVPYDSVNHSLFREKGVLNYSTMLLREDLDLLILGARETLYALDLNNVSNKRASVEWKVPQKQQEECESKGKDLKTECKNYIRILHKMEDNKMYVCGTHAFDPECDFMSYSGGKLTLENKKEDGKGKCPFDPFQRYASIMSDDYLYSATSMNFLGSEPIVTRSPVSIRTEFKSSWLNEPNFVSMAQMPESDESEGGDDDKVYLFFSEKAVECDCYNKLVVSRVARVCKGDRGGQRTLQKKWTSFLKARIDCPVLESQLPYIIQDTYRWCDPEQHWKQCLFYAVFTPQSDTSDLSAVCVYKVSEISKVFAEGKYKTPVRVETSFIKWVMYSGDVPVPRPGACIDNEARKAGIRETLDLPDQTLQFIKDKPLMDQAIQPVGGKPELVRRGHTFSRITVHQVQAADGKKYRVMFIGTEGGTILKAVNYDGEMFIIEEIHLFDPPHPIKILKFSNVTSQLYAGSDYGVAQVPLATCGRSLSCMDCVLARDPYCGWDKAAGKCTLLSTGQRELIQSVKDGNASLCSDADPVQPVKESIWPGGDLMLHCDSPSQLAEVSWRRNDRLLPLTDRLQLVQDGLLILNASHSDAGDYSCLSVESSKGNQYRATVAVYKVSISSGGNPTLPQARKDGPSVAGLQVVVALLVVSLVALLAWNFYKGHLPLPWNCRKKNKEQYQEGHKQGGVSARVILQESPQAASTEDKLLVSGADNGTRNNNHTGEEAAQNDGLNAALPSLQYIDDESVI